MTEEEMVAEGRRAYYREYMRKWRKKNKERSKETNDRFFLNHYKKMKQKEGE